MSQMFNTQLLFETETLISNLWVQIMKKKIKVSNDLDTEIMNLKSLKSFTILTNQRQCVSESKKIHGPEEYLSTWAIYFQNHHTKRNDYAINKILKPTCEDILEGNLT